ncbi:hypothetical protein HanXRQr2_Chr02g0050971 [Helianthus annuus]|uniref:Uncharacterized protein n=1 Tax=Helianthus annuus TaxID=4232 RepID=A0A251VCC8_HELAN|nr:hypothetical protein HanXRQr2_Chr02g0050971 [Helianthus annuus]
MTVNCWSTPVNRSQGWSTGHRRPGKECYNCTLASSRSWNDITQSLLASFAQEYQGCIFKTMERLE